MDSTYTEQALRFLDRFGLTFKVSYCGPDCPPFENCAGIDGHGLDSHLLPCKGIHGGKYTITIGRRGDESTLVFDFWNSYQDEYGIGDDYAKQHLGDRRTVDGATWYRRQLLERRRRVTSSGVVAEVVAKPPTEYDVLATLALDQFCPDTFEEWCADFGMDTDSRRAEKMYNACRDLAFKILKFFRDEELKELEKIQ